MYMNSTNANYYTYNYQKKSNGSISITRYKSDNVIITRKNTSLPSDIYEEVIDLSKDFSEYSITNILDLNKLVPYDCTGDICYKSSKAYLLYDNNEKIIEITTSYEKAEIISNSSDDCTNSKIIPGENPKICTVTSTSNGSSAKDITKGIINYFLDYNSENTNELSLYKSNIHGNLVCKSVYGN